MKFWVIFMMSNVGSEGVLVWFNVIYDVYVCGIKYFLIKKILIRVGIKINWFFEFFVWII